MVISPHFDRYTTYRPNDGMMGWRDGESPSHFADRIVKCAPKSKAARAGYLAMLYVLRAQSLPGACLRDADTARFQDAIDLAIGAIAPARTSVAA